MPATTTITVTFDAKIKVYTLTATDTVVPSGGGAVVLKAVGQDAIELTATPAGTPLSGMTATTAGAHATLESSVLSPFALSVVATGCTSNSLTITPQFALTLNSSGGSPHPLHAGPGASVAITAVVGTVTTSPGGLFVGESSNTISMSSAVQAFTIAADAASGHYDLAEPQLDQTPIKGKIRISSSTGAME